MFWDNLKFKMLYAEIHVSPIEICTTERRDKTAQSLNAIFSLIAGLKGKTQ